MTSETSFTDTDIAVIGMAAHMPGAGGVAEYWRNLRDGVESIRRLTRDELLSAGEPPHLIDHPDYVPAAAPLDGFEMFDADFFGLSPKEAAILDPQHRQFLEVAWEAMEDAAHPPENFPGRIGVFGGSGIGTYYWVNLRSHRDLVDEVGVFLLRHTGNDKDVLTTRVSHIFDLRGPSVNVQTACSTSLVAVHYAIQSLLGGECDMALAGGVSIDLPQLRGYLFKEGEVLSPDGHCHAFDHRARGTVFTSGAGCVALRRLADAIADGDDIRAVIRGTAVNNDGAAKAGYLAPSVDGQAAAVAEAHAVAGVSADTIDYVECHGTGTYLGDPIEIAALSEAFRKTTDRTGFCRIGSVKTNIGHTDTAAGVASLIKTVLALQHRQIPPSLGYEKPNPAIAFDDSPFVVNDQLSAWPVNDHPPRAAVNSLGVGGTNAHAILEAAPPRAASDESDWPFQIITLSARSRAALDDASARLAQWLRDNPEAPLPDVAFTLHEGRRAFDRRRVLVAATPAEAAARLEEADPRRVFTHQVTGDAPAPVFMFPGIGAQYAGMARDLYETEPTFRDWMDRGLAVLATLTDEDIRALWLPAPGHEADADAALLRPSLQTPLIMITEYALAQLWMEWGVQPSAFIGHSMGENTAAALAGVLSFEDCVALVHLRGQIFDSAPPGAMLSVPLSAADLASWLTEDLEIASANAPALSVATGPVAALDDLAARLAAENIDTRRVAVNVAAHSRMLEPFLDRFHSFLSSLDLKPPQIPIISNRSGDWLTDDEATDPGYWVAHLRNTVNFHAGLTTLSADPNRLYIEVGPGHALASLAGQHGVITPNQVISSLRHPQDDTPDDAYFLSQLGRIWAAGGSFDWVQVWGEGRRNRIALPTYPFQRRPYFIAPAAPQAAASEEWIRREDDISRWGWQEAWKPAYADCDLDPEGDLAALAPQNWLIFTDAGGHGAALADHLRAAGQTVAKVCVGDTFARRGEGDYLLAPEEGQAGYDSLVADLAARGQLPQRILHMWLVTRDRSVRPGSSFFHEVQEQGFWSLFYLARALAGHEAAPHLLLVTNNAQAVRDEPLADPEKATVMGPAGVIPREFAGVTVATLDMDAGATLPMLLSEALATPANTVAALRGNIRYERYFRPFALPPATDLPEGPVLITGGFGTTGLALARAIARRGTPVALLARTPLPPRSEWDAVLARPDNPVANRIRAVQMLEEAGGRVLAITADVTNVEDMHRARAEAEAAFGPLTGLIHAADVTGEVPILTTSIASVADALSPGLMGNEVITEVWPDGDLQWLALGASTARATAPAGQAARVAAAAGLGATARARRDARTRTVAIDWGPWQRSANLPADERQRHNLTQGIRPEEAAEAFFRAMNAGSPQVAVSALALDRLIAQEATRAPAPAAPAFERPDLDGDYIAPEGAVETRLAAIWAELLGVAQVGAEDSFFDLGGHSLVAVRLFSTMKRLWGVDLPISALFEAPTIRKLATLVDPGEGAEPEATPAVAAASTAARPRFTHLVQMHEGNGGTPFFVVGGMFGNVLNLRHLAQGLGADRPVWGLQARGLFGDAPPHDEVVDAARDMIAEMRQVHAGPWMVGGYSGGGITAYEIAQQLHAAGDEVAAVALLDTYLPQPPRLTLRDRVAIKLIEAREDGLMLPFRWYSRRRAWAQSLRDKEGDPDSPVHFHNAAIEAAFMLAISRYRVAPWNGPITLLRPPPNGRWEVAPGRWVNDERAYLSPDNDWTQFAPALEVLEVPGDHMTLVLEPNVRVLAARLARVLAAADRTKAAPGIAAE